MALRELLEIKGFDTLTPISCVHDAGVDDGR